MPGELQFLRGQLLQTPALPKTALTGLTVMITGANTGLGLDAAKHVARLGAARLVLGVRSVAKGERAKADVLASVSGSKSTAAAAAAAAPRIDVWEVDFSSAGSVRAFAERCAAELGSGGLDAAVLNAGVSMAEFELVDEKEGGNKQEMTVAVNVLGNLLLAVMLVPTLRKSIAHGAVKPAGWVPTLSIVGSAVHFWVDTKQLSQPAKGMLLASLAAKLEPGDMQKRYFLSKLMVLLLVRELAARISKSVKDKGLVVVNNPAPGLCRTELFRHEEKTWNAGQRMALKVVARSSEEGSRTLVHSIVAGKTSHGEYLSECQVKGHLKWIDSQEGRECQARIWEEVMEWCERAKPGVSAEL